MTKSNKSYLYNKNNIKLIKGDALEILTSIENNSIDMIFADPPYMLSNNGFTCQNGRMVNVNKGKWDKSNGFNNDLQFHELWIKECRRILKPEGTIWISGTYHSIYQCGFLLQKLDFHFLNDITWFKANASPNLSCRFFTASHETLLWARKHKKAKHYFNYQAIKSWNYEKDFIKKHNKQMRSVWAIPTTPLTEKKFGKHPTQKPLELLKRIIVASSNEKSLILDPFCGSGTTAVAIKIIGNRNFIGIDNNNEYLNIAKQRIENI